MSTVVEQSRHPSPPALRLRRPGWRDPRLLVGVMLIAASVSLGSWLLSAAGRTVEVYAARGALVPGEAVDAAHLVVVQVRLPDATGYLTPQDDLSSGLVAVRTVGDAELVPVAAVSAASDLAYRSVAVVVAGALSRGVVEGAQVDLWFVPEPPSDRPAGAAAAEAPAPRQLADALTVAEVLEPDGAFSVGSRATVQVLVPVADLATVLQALSGDGSVQLVPVPGSSRRP